MRVWASTLVLSLAPVVLCGQELTPEALVKPGIDSWPTYNGEYSGQRHSPLDQINGSNVASLSLAWMYRASNYGAAGFGSVIKSTPIEVNGMLYFTMPDNVWAIDARNGREIWHYATLKLARCSGIGIRNPIQANLVPRVGPMLKLEAMVAV